MIDYSGELKRTQANSAMYYLLECLTPRLSQTPANSPTSADSRTPAKNATPTEILDLQFLSGAYIILKQ